MTEEWYAFIDEDFVEMQVSVNGIALRVVATAGGMYEEEKP